LDVSHHRWQRNIFSVSREDKIANEEVGERAKECSTASTFSERRLCWLGHVLRMDHQRIPQQALYWEVPGFKRGPGRPRTNWRGVVKKDLRRMGFAWEEAEVAALDRLEWRRRVAQYVSMDVG